MNVSYVLRHARTQLSSRYLCSGDPVLPVPLDAEGREQCHRLAVEADWLDDIAVVITSQFTRARQTAALLIGGRAVDRRIEARLNEIDYGKFEGGPWLDYGAWLAEHGPDASPPGGHESWREAVCRLLDGLEACLSHPGPRLLVGHGLLISVATALRDGRRLNPLGLPERPYVSPLTLTDIEVKAVSDAGRRFVTLASG